MTSSRIVVKTSGSSTTIGPADPHTELVESLGQYALMCPSESESLRRLAWFLGDRGHAEAAEAIMEHAKVREPGNHMYGVYFPT